MPYTIVDPDKVLRKIIKICNAGSQLEQIRKSTNLSEESKKAKLKKKENELLSLYEDTFGRQIVVACQGHSTCEKLTKLLNLIGVVNADYPDNVMKAKEVAIFTEAFLKAKRVLDEGGS